MRYVVMAGVCLAILVGCAAQQQAVAPQRLPDDAVGTLTTKEAIGKMGAPTYQRLCEDGSTTLGWKHAAPPQSRPVDPGRLLILRSPDESKESLVCKFDQQGKLLWWREVK